MEIASTFDKVDVFTIGFICGGLVVGFVVWLLAVVWAPVSMDGDTFWDAPPDYGDNSINNHKNLINERTNCKGPEKRG